METGGGSQCVSGQFIALMLHKTHLYLNDTMVLQEFQLPSQHVYRSMRRRNARETREANTLQLQLQLSQLKFEQGELLQELMWWRSWYHGNGWQETDPFIECGPSGVEYISEDTLSGRVDVKKQCVNAPVDMEEKRRGIDLLLLELGGLTAAASDQGSTNLDSLIASSSCADSVADDCCIDGANNIDKTGIVHMGTPSCMGQGRGHVRRNNWDAKRCNVERSRTTSSIGCGRSKDASGLGGDAQGFLNVIAWRIRRDLVRRDLECAGESFSELEARIAKLMGKVDKLLDQG